MLIESTFGLPLAIDRAWELLTDVEQVAPCVPGVELDGRDGDDYRGRMRVKVGPVTARYECSLRFAELDPEARVAVLEAEGREVRGQGTAAATVTTRISPDGDGARVDLATELAVTGRLAQFGRGVMEDVSNRLVTQFAERLREELMTPSGHSGEDPTISASANGERPEVVGESQRPEPEALDLLAAARGPLLRAIAVPLGALVLGFLLGRTSR